MRLRNVMAGNLSRTQNRISVLAGKLHALSPLQVMSRGYATVAREDGHIIGRMAGIHPGETIRVRFHDGSLDARVEAVHPSAMPQ